MKKIVFILVCVWFSAGLWAQTEQQQVAPAPKFKPHYAGASVNAGFMLMPHYGSAFYVAPKLTFQAAPRLFVNAGVGLIQYNPTSSQMKFDGGGSLQRTATGAYIFAEGVYLLNERWSINGSVMKDVSPSPMRRATPYSIPSEAMHFGVDYRITPNITVGDILYIVIFAVLMLAGVLEKYVKAKRRQIQDHTPRSSPSRDMYEDEVEPPAPEQALPQTLEEMLKRMHSTETQEEKEDAYPEEAQSLEVISETPVRKNYYQPVVNSMSQIMSQSEKEAFAVPAPEEEKATSGLLEYEFDIRRAIISSEILNKKY